MSVKLLKQTYYINYKLNCSITGSTGYDNIVILGLEFSHMLRYSND